MGDDAGSKEAYSAMMYSNMSAQDKANWYLQTGQTAQANAYQNVALAQSAGNIGVSTLQAGLAYSIESAPGVAPPPFTGKVWWDPATRAARDEELLASGGAMVSEQRKRREAGVATSEVRTSAGAQERIARSEMESLRGFQEAARGQRLKEETAEARVAMAQKHAAEQAQFKYKQQQREREREAKLNLLAAGGQIVGKTLQTAANVIPGAMAQRQANVATAGQYGMTVGEYTTARKAQAQVGKIGQDRIALERSIGVGEATQAQADQLTKLKAQQLAAYKKGIQAGAPSDWYPSGTFASWEDQMKRSHPTLNIFEDEEALVDATNPAV